jgi:hypothetical protein
MSRGLLAGSYIQADETPVGVQMHDGRGKNQQAWLWQYGRPGGGVMFDFRLGRGREGPKRFLGQFERHPAKRRLCGLRQCWRPEDGARGVLGPFEKKVF